MDLDGMGKGLILLGVALVLLGAVLHWGPRLPWLGHLPGDFLIRRDRVTIFLPLTTCLLLSLLLSLLARLFFRW